MKVSIAESRAPPMKLCSATPPCEIEDARINKTLRLARPEELAHDPGRFRRTLQARLASLKRWRSMASANGVRANTEKRSMRPREAQRLLKRDRRRSFERREQRRSQQSYGHPAALRAELLRVRGDRRRGNQCAREDCRAPAPSAAGASVRDGLSLVTIRRCEANQPHRFFVARESRERQTHPDPDNCAEDAPSATLPRGRQRANRALAQWRAEQNRNSGATRQSQEAERLKIPHSPNLFRSGNPTAI